MKIFYQNWSFAFLVANYNKGTRFSNNNTKKNNYENY